MTDREESQYAYIRRRGRITKGQERALDVLRERYVVTTAQITQAKAPIGIEVGFGMGQALLSWAQQQPDWSLFGIELYEPGVGALLSGIDRLGLENLRILMQPAQEVFAALAPATVQEVRIFFPDPWPKKRHHKRRLIQADFVEALANALAPGGLVRLATDWAPYADWITECFALQPKFQPQAPETVRDPTNFERRGERLGHDTFEFQYNRCS